MTHINANLTDEAAPEHPGGSGSDGPEVSDRDW